MLDIKHLAPRLLWSEYLKKSLFSTPGCHSHSTITITTITNKIQSVTVTVTVGIRNLGLEIMVLFEQLASKT
jgi:hypothetical protein